MADSSAPLDESDFEIMDYLKEKKTIIILNKSDLDKEALSEFDRISTFEETKNILRDAELFIRSH